MAAQVGDVTKKRLTKKSVLVQCRKKCAKCRTGLEKELVAGQNVRGVSADETGGWEPVQIITSAKKEAQDPDYVAYVFVFLRSIIFRCFADRASQYNLSN